MFVSGCDSEVAGQGEWGEYSDWGVCSASCDYGFNYRTRSCIVADTCLEGEATDYQLCFNFRCDGT